MKEKEEAEENKCWMQNLWWTEHGTTPVLYWIISSQGWQDSETQRRSEVHERLTRKKDQDIEAMEKIFSKPNKNAQEALDIYIYIESLFNPENKIQWFYTSPDCNTYYMYMREEIGYEQTQYMTNIVRISHAGEIINMFVFHHYMKYN